MSLITIYTPQNGEFLKTILDAVVTLLNSATFKTGVNIVQILAVSMVGYQYISGQKLAAISRYTVTSFIIIFCLMGLKINVAIIDMQTADGAGKALTVDHVPIGIALPAGLISGMGYGITKAFSLVFHMTGELDYTKSGMIFGARTWLSSTAAELSQTPEVARDLSSYIRQCIFSAKILGSQQIGPSELVQSPDLIALYFKDPSPIYRVVFANGANLSCKDASKELLKRLKAATNTELKRLSELLNKGKSSQFSNALTQAHQYYMKISKDASSILTQNILINATRSAASDAFAFTGADAELLNFTNSTSLQKMHIAEANSFWLAGFRLPYYMTVMWLLTICIFPLVVLIAFFPTMNNVYGFYVQSQVYLWSWPPLFIIIHFFVSLASASSTNIFGTKEGGGVTFVNIDAISNIHNNFAFTASALAASVPFLAYYITKGLSSVLSTASQHFGGMAQSLSVSEAQSAAQGNISMASYSGWNMNYDNTNAHKFDTNYSHLEGRATVQMPNGAMLSETQSGARIGNIEPAMSSAAVSVHASDRMADSLSRSASESFSHASNLRSAADQHWQTGISKLRNFNEQHSNDYRDGVSESRTANDSYSQDFRKMEDAIKGYNAHADHSHQISKDTAYGLSANSNRSLFGKGIKWTTGISGDASVHKRHSDSNGESEQAFRNSSYGKSFQESFSHMVSEAKSSHLDKVDSKSLSHSEQIAANFAKGESLMRQSSQEYSHAEQLQNTASHIKEHANNIDSNLNQAYHEWVVSRFGVEGEAVLLRTDTQSIAQQNQWVNEFLTSSVGQSALQGEVNDFIGSHNASTLKGSFEHQEKLVGREEDIKTQFNNDSMVVSTKERNAGLRSMGEEKRKELNNLDQHNLPVKNNIQEKVNETIHRNDMLYSKPKPFKPEEEK